MSKTILIDNDNDCDNDNKNENENVNMIKQSNDCLGEIIDKSKPFEDQLKLLIKVKNLNEYWHSKDYGDKELKFKMFN